MGDPVLKWAGGKRQLLDEIYTRFPDAVSFANARYHEPFLGGGAVFFDLEPERATINDTNVRLMNFYRQVRERPEEIIEVCENFNDPESDPVEARDFSDTNRRGRDVEQYYYQQREIFNNRPYDDEFDKLEEAALLLYLNRTCFNGLYRENNSGGFNVPIGRYANPDYVQAERLREVSEVLRGGDITLKSRDFEYVLDEATEGDIVYFDPPYKPMSATAYFTDYSADGFGKDDQERLLNVAQELDSNGVTVVLSNSGVMADLYKEAGFDVGIEGARRVINSDATSRGEVDEIIATNATKIPAQ
ncbi:DNA adenine methylase [Haloferax sp. DFSO52]|uniref:DNA adenine methylase n=1 Tax=Haloferax sp. DFSO52 TaxID=3388505 RepID=UPI003A882E28